MAPRGRPRSFDRDRALERVMDVFWEKGYDHAQIVDLTAALGVTPPSFYAAFGSKEAAFREAVDVYIDRVAGMPMRSLDAARTARDGLRAMLEGSIGIALSREPGGCLLILGVVGRQPSNAAAHDRLLDARRETVALIERRLERAVREGDLPDGVDAAQLAGFYHGVMQAVSFQARDGATRAQLEALIEPALAPLGSP